MARELGPHDWEDEGSPGAAPGRGDAFNPARYRKKARRRIWPYVLVGLAVVAGGGGAGWYFLGPLLRGQPARDLSGVRLSSSDSVILYFADPRWTKLVPETRQLPPRSDSVAQIRALFAALAAGPTGDASPVLPKGSKLRAAYVGREGLAVLDLEPWPEGTELGGTSGELLTVFSLVETVARNVPGVRSVQILVDGQERETLDGHVKISEPLSPEPAANEPVR